MPPLHPFAVLVDHLFQELELRVSDSPRKLQALSRCFQRNAGQSITLSVVRVFVPVKFVFSTRTARSSAPSRLTRRIEGCELRMKYWEIIARNMKKRGGAWIMSQTLDSHGRTIWIADAHRHDGKRLVVHADEKLTAFVELE